MRPKEGSVCESHGRSISSGPVDWPLLELRRSAAMRRYSDLNSSIELNGPVKPEIAEFNPPPEMSNNGKPEPVSSRIQANTDWPTAARQYKLSAIGQQHIRSGCRQKQGGRKP